jgi:Membrane bound O-acyl transferase family
MTFPDNLFSFFRNAAIFVSEYNWPHKWTDDARLPVWEFKLQDSSEYGLYIPNIPFWVHLVLTVLLECLLVSFPTALLMYFGIIRAIKEKVPSKPQTHNPSRTNVWGYLLGWFILLPAWIVLPPLATSELGVTNNIMRFCLCVISPTISIFRILEAMYGFAPSHAMSSCGAYALYFTSPLLLVPATTKNRIWRPAIYHHLPAFLAGLFITGMYQSLLLELLPYGTGPGSTPSHLYTWSALLDLEIWYITLSYGILLQSYLCTFAAGLAMTTVLLTGHETQVFSRAPLFLSTSPSDFWGRRWNLLIHTCLKRGVYQPIRSLGGPAVLAVISAFAASGLFHEWLLPAVMPDYPHTHGTTMAFFLWQALLIVLERTLSPRIRLLGLPGPLRTMCVIALGLPPAHWFLDSYLRSQFFVHGQWSFPMVRPLLARD